MVPWLAGGLTPAAGQRPLNLDFERPAVAYADRPWGWTFGWSAFTGGPAATFALDSAHHRGGTRSLRIALADSSPAVEPQMIMLQVPADFARGRELRLTGWVRAESLRGKALITLEAWKDREFAGADTATIGGNSAPRDWSLHELLIQVPNESAVHSVVISLGVEGSGTAWFDDLELTVDGTPASSLPVPAEPPTPADLAWLATHATPLRDVRPPGAGPPEDHDLQGFADIVGSARVVGLGESTHGTREFFLVKHRLLEYLVRAQGFRVFGIEANQLAVERINRYVQGGTGTAPDVMRVMFQVWNTEAMRDLVERMRAYNASHPDRPVRFAGYDMQDHRTPADTLRAFLTRVDPAFAPRVEELIGEYRSQRSSATPQIEDTVRARWSRQADALWELVRARRADWLARSATPDDTLAVEWGVQAANLVRQAARFNVALSSPERDSLMAANVDWLLRTIAPGERAVVWAHDVHVSHGGDPVLSFNGGAQMGAYLSRTFGYDYRAFSLLTYDGAYRATRSFTDHRMIAAQAYPGPPGSLEAALHALEMPASSVGWVVDLRPARTDERGVWLRRPRPIRHVGFAAYDYGFELNAILPLEFDGVVFVDQTTPSRPLP